jgi:hypothetical protein
MSDIKSNPEIKESGVIRFPLENWAVFKDFYSKNKMQLDRMGLDSVAALIRWCANEGLPIVEIKLDMVSKKAKEHYDVEKKV